MFNPGVAESTQGLATRTVWGVPHLQERVRGVTLTLSATAFFQTLVAGDETFASQLEAAGAEGFVSESR